MKRLILQLVALIIIIYLTILVGSYFFRQELDPENYLSTIVLKHQLLAQSTSSRIIFIGDSSLAFGLEGEKVQREIGQPVVNMGLHAALGLPFIFKEITPDLRSGDTVVVVEHYYPTKDDINAGVVCHALDFYPEMYIRLDSNIFSKNKQIIDCKIKKIRRYLLNRLFQSDNSNSSEKENRVFGYKSWAFNSFGDIYSDLYVTSTINFANAPIPEFDKNQEETLATYNYYSRLYAIKGVKLILIYPPYSQTVFDSSNVAINDFDWLLRTKTNLKIMNHPIDSVLPDEYFFNSDYHLNSIGKVKYTDLVIKILKQELNQ